MYMAKSTLKSITYTLLGHRLFSSGFDLELDIINALVVHEPTWESFQRFKSTSLE